jgi:hypothetical protein
VGKASSTGRKRVKAIELVALDVADIGEAWPNGCRGR